MLLEATVGLPIELTKGDSRFAKRGDLGLPIMATVGLPECYARLYLESQFWQLFWLIFKGSFRSSFGYSFSYSFYYSLTVAFTVAFTIVSTVLLGS